MQTDNEYQKSRELLIDKILNCNSSLKPAKSSLEKKNYEELIELLFHNAIEAEKELWREAILKKITSFEPDTESKYNSSGLSLLTTLVNVISRNCNK
jgi:hypothetical protein